MKIFKNKLLVKLIASLCLVLTFLNFGMTSSVYAGDDDEEAGVLIIPVMNLLTGIADGIMDIMHNAVLGQTETLIKLDGTADSWWGRHGSKVLGWIVGIAAAAIVVVCIAASGGAAAVAGVGVIAKISATCFIIKATATATAIGAISGIGVATIIDASTMTDDIYLPIFKITPEEIFANELPMFDVNFFKPMDAKTTVNYGTPQTTYVTLHDYGTQQITNTDKVGTTEVHLNISYYEGIYLDKDLYVKDIGKDTQIYEYVIKNANDSGKLPWTIDDDDKIKIQKSDAYTFKITVTNEKNEVIHMEESNNVIFETVTTNTNYVGGVGGGTGSREEYKGTKKKLSYITTQPTVASTQTMNSTAAELRKVVSEWYFNLRNLALLVLMLVLIYTGIKIVIGSTAGEKAKHKERLMDWIVAMCLIFIMHYIMTFAITLTEEIIKMVDKIDGENSIIKIMWLTNQNHIDNAEKYLTDLNGQNYVIKDELGKTGIRWGTDLVGGMRIEQQTVNEGTYNWIGYGLCYIILVVYTIIFTWTYLKRVLYVAFLTMIAPLVAMTYPIDKITDGKAQAFNAWLKEYIFNLLIQPFHLLLYTVLVGSAFQLAGSNIIYSIVAIGFMTPAEKLLRKFFGFDKAQTPGLLGGAAGAALAMTGMKSLMKQAPKDKGGDKEKESKDSGNIKFSNSNSPNPKGVIADSLGIPSSGVEDDEAGSPISLVNPGVVSNVSAGGTPVGGARQRTVGGAPVARANMPVGMSEGQESTDAVSLVGRIPTRGGSVPTRSSAVPSKAKWAYVPRGRKNNNKPSTGKRILSTLGAGIGAYARGQGNKIYKRTKNARPIRSLARGIVGAAGAATFGMAGLALGIASGDPSKAFQYTTAGLAGGFGAGRGLGGSAVDALSVDTKQIKDEMEMSYYGDDYKKIKLDQEKREMQHSEEYINTLRKTLGVSRGEAQEILRTTGSYCFDANIKSAEDIAAVEKMTKQIYDSQIETIEKEKKANGEDPTLTDQERESVWDQSIEYTASMKSFQSKMPNISQMTDKKRGEYERRFEREMDAEFRKQIGEDGIMRMQADEMTKMMRDDKHKVHSEVETAIKKEEESSGETLSDQRKEQIRQELLEGRAKQNVDRAIALDAKKAAKTIIEGATAYDDVKSGLYKA